MSYEGYEQHICEDGHYFCKEAHGYNDACFCGKKSVWCNCVDDTNCDSYGIIDMDQFIEFPEEFDECRCCGHKKLVKEAKYRVPTKDETKYARKFYDFDTDEYRFIFKRKS